jgi:hypothetical protein
MSEIKRVRVKFLDAMAGLRDPTPATLAAKYARLADSMKAEKAGKQPAYTDSQIQAAVDVSKKADTAVVPTGFAKDWFFKAGDEASVNEVIAKHWEAAGQVAILPAASAK